jgi:BlaI family transcriptional regulator, penicillinase repressor
VETDGCRGSNSLGQIESRMRPRNPTICRFTAVLGRSATPGVRRLSHQRVQGERCAFRPRERAGSSSLSTVPTSLTDLQLAIMRILWDRAEATVLDVQNRLRPERDLAQTTIATLLSRLEKRGVVEHRLEGRQFVYRPLITEQDVRGSMVSELTELLFNGSSAALMSHLLRSRDMNPGDLDRVKRMIAEAENGTRRAASLSRETALNDGDGDAG